MKIFGYIENESGEKLQAASVVLASDNSIGVSADENGIFILENTKITPESDVKISFIGYATQIKKASDLQGTKIVLVEAPATINEIIVSVQKPKENTSVKGNFKQFYEKNKKPIGIVSALAIIATSVFIIKKQF